jgi:hypothetical protein
LLAAIKTTLNQLKSLVVFSWGELVISWDKFGFVGVRSKTYAIISL